jgi:gamma-glutamyltranspeptidase
MGMLRKQVLQPGIELAEQGFPVSPVTAYHWKACAGALAM